MGKKIATYTGILIGLYILVDHEGGTMGLIGSSSSAGANIIGKLQGRQ